MGSTAFWDFEGIFDPRDIGDRVILWDVGWVQVHLVCSHISASG